MTSKLNRSLVLLLVVVFFAHFFISSIYTVNLPYWDEWDQWRGWTGPLDIKWLFSPHNEHLVVPSRVLEWALMKWDPGNFALMQKLSFLVFGLLLVSLIAFFSRLTASFSMTATLGFSLFFLSTGNFENHDAVFSSFHLCSLFFILAALLLFTRKLSVLTVVAATICAVLSIISLAPGILLALCLGGGFLAHSWQERKRIPTAVPLSLCFLLVVGLAALGWFFLNGNSGGHLPRTSIFTREFGKFYLNLLSFGFGFGWLSSLPGVLALLIVIVPPVLTLPRLGLLSETDRRAFWAVSSMLLGQLLVTAAIASGRASLGVGASKSSRYNEILLLIVPLCAVAWSLLLIDKPHLKKRFLVTLWLITFIAYADKWSLKPYSRTFVKRKEGQRCLANYYASGGDGLCPTLHPAPLSERLNLAKALNFSFYREAAGSN